MIEQNSSKAERVEFTYNTDLYLWLFAGSLLAAIVYFFVLEPEQGHIVVTYWIPLLVFIFGTCWLFLAVKKTPAFILSDEGFIDNRMGFGKIEWEDVTFAEIKTPAPGSKAGKFLAVGVRDKEKYLGRLGNWARKRQNGITIPGSSYLVLDAKYIKGAGFGKQKLETAAQEFIKRLGKPDLTPVQPELLS